ncbi:MAG: adenylyltransferase/cytidyltransferase family protein [Rhizomicrobium sp.]
MSAPSVLVGGGFDDIRARDIRFLEEAAKFGEVTVLLLDDEEFGRRNGKPPKFPFAERAYFLNAVRFVKRVVGIDSTDTLGNGNRPSTDVWLDRETDSGENSYQASARRLGIPFRIIPQSKLRGFPVSHPPMSSTERKKVAVTGCYDWFHSGHVRFFEEASVYGDLTVFVGNDACIRELKGEGHPLLPQDERRYVVGAIRYVNHAVISSGNGWLDFDAEIRVLKPDILAVNEDGDKGGKREYCRELGIEYLVLKRTPAPGLPKRSSTELRGF